MINSLAELEQQIAQGKEFEAKNQEYWEDYNPQLAMIKDVQMIIADGRLRVKTVAMIDAVIIYKPCTIDDVVLLKIYDTPANILNNFKTANYQQNPIWSRLINRDTGGTLEVFYRDKEDTK